MFGFIIWLVIGGAFGWLASVAMRTDKQQGILTNIIVGMVGAYVGGAFVAPYLRSGAYSGYLSAVFGAVILLGVLTLTTRNKVR